MAEVVVSTPAYCKLVLHAAKYPHRAVNGVLLAEKPKNKDVKSVRVVDAVPLFHQALTLAPMMEVALIQVDAHCRSQGLVIAGYYQANENARDSEPTAVAYKVAERIQDYFEQACLVMVDGHKMSLDCEEEVIRLWQHTDGKWKQKDCKGCLESGTLAAISSLLATRAHRELIDFDNHLDNITLDWKNLQINELLKQTLYS